MALKKKNIIIVNPMAGNGSAAQTWKKLAPKISFLGSYDEMFSAYAGHITQLTRDALKAGAQRILIVGGDGSLTEALNGFFENDDPIHETAILGTIPMGTGSDFLKSFGLKNREEVIGQLEKEHIQLCDVGRVTYTTESGASVSKLFLNIASFGCSGEIVNRVHRSDKRFGAKLTYLGAMASAFLTYKNPEVDIECDEKEKTTVKINNVFICNGKYSGGGMCWGPKASVSDRKFDITIVKNIPKLTGILHMNKIYNGTVLEMEGIAFKRCSTLKASSKQKIPIEVDGDITGYLPATFQIYSHPIRFWY